MEPHGAADRFSNRFFDESWGSASWLKAAHYTTVILRRHVFRLDRTLRSMPGAAPGATFTTVQQQTAFGKHRRPASRLINFRGTQRAYQRFLRSQGRLERLEDKTGDCRFAYLRQRYERHLIEVRGVARSTWGHHSTTVADFLERRLRPRQQLRALTGADIERFVGVRSAEIARQSLQHTVAALRAFLLWCMISARFPHGLTISIHLAPIEVNCRPARSSGLQSRHCRALLIVAVSPASAITRSFI